MNPPKTAQIVKTKLLDRVLPAESLLSLSVTLGILKLKHKIRSENLKLKLKVRPKRYQNQFCTD